jgi:hypothetical protein
MVPARPIARNFVPLTLDTTFSLNNDQSPTNSRYFPVSLKDLVCYLLLLRVVPLIYLAVKAVCGRLYLLISVNSKQSLHERFLSGYKPLYPVNTAQRFKYTRMMNITDVAYS